MATTIGGLALAIGVSTSVFSLLNGTLMLRPGVTDPDSVAVVLSPWKNGVSSGWSYAEYAALRDMAGDIRLEAASQLATSVRFSPTAPDPVNDDPQPVPTAFVSGTYLSTLGARPALGRLLAADDDSAGAAPVAVVGHIFWARRLGADPAIVGRPVWLSGIPVTVVGVAAQGFRGVTDDPPAFWLTLSSQRTIHGGAPLTRTSTTHVHVVARRPAGMSVRQAADRVGALAVAGGRDSTDPYRATGATLLPVTQRLLAPPARSILLAVTAILTAVALVVILACVNVANLQLASAFARQREIGVRRALGASRGRFVRQLITESVVLGWMAGALGLALTFWLVPVLARLIRLPITYDASPDGRVYVVLLLVSCVAAIGAELGPARHGTRGDLMTPLKGDGPRLGPAGRPGRLRTTLIGVQAAVSVLLLLVASLAARAAVRAATIEVGYDPEHLIGVTPALGRATGTDATTYMTQALERIRGIGSVRAAAFTEVTPFAGVTIGLNFDRDGRRIRAFLTRTDAEYFSTLGLRTVRGRTYTPSEVAAAAPVAVVSETLARQLWGGDDPIGKVLEEFAIVDRAPRVTVIGVVSDAVVARLEEIRLAAIFRPLTRFSSARILVRTTARPEAVTPALQPLDLRVRADVAIVRDGLHDAIHQPRVVALLASSVAALALVLAAIGIYGVTAFVTGQRTREIGVRLAVGASRADVLRLLLGDGLRPILIGLACGIGAALIAAQAFQGAMYGVTARDPVAFAAAAVILLVAAAAAVFFPTRRASRLNPVVVLRQS